MITSFEASFRYCSSPGYEQNFSVSLTGKIVVSCGLCRQWPNNSRNKRGMPLD